MSEFDLQVGSTISHFRLEKKLGEGGMGAVYLAEDLTLGRRVAIKFMSRRLLAQQANPAVRENIEQRFIREARSAAAINHPNIAQIFEANFDSDNWFIAMELIDGYALADRLADGRKFGTGEIIDIATQTINGLKHAWDEYKIIHRDIKPHNIMITKSGRIKIVDMGLAKPVADVDEDLPELTGAGTPIGTPHYMAPEQATGDSNVDFRVDIYALGASLYEVASGQKAFNGKTAPMIYMAQMAKKYTPLNELRPDLPDYFCQLIDAMLEPKLANRIGTYDKCLDMLKAPIDDAVTVFGDVPTVLNRNSPSSSVPSSSGYGDFTHISTILGFSIGVAAYLPADHLIVGRYRVLKPIGRSRAGVVYHCLDKQLGIECAVKSLLPGREFPANAMASVRQNFQRLLSKSHPNLAQIRDLHEDPASGELFIVMEMLNGRNLRAYTHRLQTESGGEPLAWSQVESVLRRVAAAIDSTNIALGFPHGDIKPESIFLINNDTEVKLLDYGISELAAPEGTTIGTELVPLANSDYMAPEVWQLRQVSARTDQYAFSVVVWEILGRRLPFWLRDGMDVNAATIVTDAESLYTRLRDRVLNDAPPAHPNANHKLSAALNRGLAKDPAKRFASCTALINSVAGGGLPIVPIAIAAAVVLAGIGAFVVMNRKKPVENPVVAVITPGTEQPTLPNGNGTTPPVSPIVPPVAPPVGQQPVTPEPPALPPPTIPPKVEIIPPEPPKPAGPTPAELAALKAAEEAAAAEAAAAAAAEQVRIAAVRQEREARRLQESYLPLREALSANPHLKDDLPALDKAAQAAAAKLDEKAFADAIQQFTQTIENAKRLKAQGDERLQQDAQALKKTIDALRAHLKPYEGVDQRVAQEIVAMDVAIGLARDHADQLDFDKALAQYVRAREAGEKLSAHVDATYTPKIGSNFVLDKTGAPFIWVASLNGWVAKYETTNGQYRRFKSAHDSRKQEGFSLNGDRQPVVEVSYLDAVAFCEWLNAVAAERLPEGYRFGLPSKEQWLTIAHCGSERLFPWGNDWPPKYGNFGNQEVFPGEWKLDGYVDDLFPVTCDVEKSGENEWGLAGVAGNVWEWSTEQKDATRAVLGGSWTSNSKATIVCDPKGKVYAPLDQPFDNIGFRIFVLKAAN